RGRTSADVLAIRVAAVEAGVSPIDVDADRHGDVAIDLHHRHLPKLDDVGLIDLTDGGAAATDRAARFELVLEAVEGAADPDAALSALADRRRRSVLEHVARVDEPIGLDALAERIVAQSDDARDDVALDLHHHHLPKLDDAGFLAYDAEDRRVDDAREFPFEGDLGEAVDRIERDAALSGDGSTDVVTHISL
ncbi:hypothetical protein ACFQDG_06755, partial [Natronoarchaeum mannanilyticum]